MRHQDLKYNILAPGIVEFPVEDLIIGEDGLAPLELKSNRIISSDKKINYKLEKLQKTVLECLVSYCDLYKESIHTLQWQEKYQFFVMNPGSGIQNINLNASSSINDKIDYLPFTRKIACYVFLNDDYEGGSIKFDQFEDLIYKPKGGTILLLPADFMYTHSVNPVLSHYRLSLFTAFHGGKDIDSELYEKEKGIGTISLSYMR